MVKEIFDAHHNAVYGGGHMGFHRTYNRNEEKFFIRKLSKLLIVYLSSCLDCAKRKPTNMPAVGRMNPSEIYSLFTKFQIDVLGPLRVTPRQNK